MADDFRNIRNLPDGFLKSFLVWFLDIENITQTCTSVSSRANDIVLKELDVLDTRVQGLQASIRKGFPQESTVASVTGKSVPANLPAVVLFKPMALGHIPTMAELLEERDEEKQRQKIQLFENHLRELIDRQIAFLVSVQYDLVYSDLEHARYCLQEARAIRADIARLEATPIFSKISAQAMDDIDSLDLMLGEEETAVQTAEPPRPKVRRSFSEIAAVLRQQYRNRRDEAEDILRALKNLGIRALYHLTDRRNLASINYHQGIYACPVLDELLDEASRQALHPGTTLQSKGIDMDRHTENYVHLYFSENPAAIAQMKARGLDPVALQIDIDVTALDSTEFSNEALGAVSAKLTDKSTQSYVQFIETNAEHFTSKKHPDAVALVRNGIPKQYITNLTELIAQHQPTTRTVLYV